MTNINGFDRLFKFAAKSLQKTFGFITVNQEFENDEMAAVNGLQMFLRGIRFIEFDLSAMR